MSKMIDVIEEEKREQERERRVMLVDGKRKRPREIIEDMLKKDRLAAEG